MINERKKHVIKETIKHWIRMIKWAEKQNPTDKTNFRKMADEIYEEWHSQDCKLCMEFSSYTEQGYHRCWYEDSNIIYECPLAEKFADCAVCDADKDREVNFWLHVNKSKTWEEWVINANIFLNQIISLLEG